MTEHQLRRRRILDWVTTNGPAIPAEISQGLEYPLDQVQITVLTLLGLGRLGMNHDFQVYVPCLAPSPGPLAAGPDEIAEPAQQIRRFLTQWSF